MISVIVAVFASCGHQTKLTDTTDEILMQVGDSTLTRSQVIQQIPSGLDIADSVRLFDAIVENWLEKYMLSEVARLNIPDIDRIENMVQEYRRQLLSNEYRRVMAQERVKNLPIDSVKAYYDAHIDEFVLAEPIRQKCRYYGVVFHSNNLYWAKLIKFSHFPKKKKPANHYGRRLFSNICRRSLFKLSFHDKFESECLGSGDGAGHIDAF